MGRLHGLDVTACFLCGKPFMEGKGRGSGKYLKFFPNSTLWVYCCSGCQKAPLRADHVHRVLGHSVKWKGR